MLEDYKTANLWYRYFEKGPQYVDLEEVYKSKKVILGRLNGAYNRLATYNLEGIKNINTADYIGM